MTPRKKPTNSSIVVNLPALKARSSSQEDERGAGALTASGQAIVGFDTQVNRRLIVVLCPHSTMDAFAVYDNREAAYCSDRTELALGENGVTRIHEVVFKLSTPGTVAVVEYLDAPELGGGEWTTDRLVDLPVSDLALFGLGERAYISRNRG